MTRDAARRPAITPVTLTDCCRSKLLVSSVASTGPTANSPALFDENIEAAEMRGHVGDKLCHLSRVTLVSFERDCCYALSLEIAYDRFAFAADMA